MCYFFDLFSIIFLIILFKSGRFLDHNFGKVENTVDEVVFMGVCERSCNLNYVSEDEAYIEVWDLLHTSNVA